MRASFLTLPLCLAPLWLVACSEFELQNGEGPAVADGPDIRVEPPVLDYGQLGPGGTATQAFTITNIGSAPLSVDGAEVSVGAEAYTLAQPFNPVLLEPQEQLSVEVKVDSFGTTHLGQISVFSDDPDTAEATVDLITDPIPGQEPVLVEDSWVVLEDPPVDILFALDTSGSMTDDRAALGRAFTSFIQEIDDVTDDWQIGAVTKDSGCFNNGIITASTPNYESVFNDAVTGLNILHTDLAEALLELVNNSLEKTTPGSCNEGFLRAGALLHVVVISDEPEQSGTPWDEWVTKFAKRMSDPNLLMISGVVDVNGTCGSPADGYVEAAQATGGVLLDICNANWGDSAEVLGLRSAAGLLSYSLSKTPDPSTIVVYVDGVAYPNGWHYDAVRNTVVIDVELPPGAVVTVTYIEA